jgi:hypothetical protein
MASYESELTGFLRRLQQEHPEIEKSQREARARWWDTNPDADEQRAFRDARVRRGSYVFYPDADGRPGG